MKYLLEDKDLSFHYYPLSIKFLSIIIHLNIGSNVNKNNYSYNDWNHDNHNYTIDSWVIWTLLYEWQWSKCLSYIKRFRSSQQPHVLNSFLRLNLQMRKLKQSGVKQLDDGHSATNTHDPHPIQHCLFME